MALPIAVIEHARRNDAACVQCQTGRMVRSRVPRSPAVRVIGYALWADALLSLLLTVAGSWIATPQQELSALLKAETVGWMRARTSLPAAVVDEFVERESITPETLARVSGADRWDLRDKLELYQTRAARAAVLEALAGFADMRMWWCSAALFAGGWLLLRRRRAWLCHTCGASSHMRESNSESSLAW